jgi:hypothetical protein
MSESNPYQPPGVPLVTSESPAASDITFSAAPRMVAAGRGWEWIAEGFGLFKKQPGMWILLVVGFVICSVVIAVIPFVGPIANMLLLQVFMGGLMLGCRALDRGEGLEIGHLFAGFKQNTGDLVVLGVLALVGWFVALIPAFIIIGGGAFMSMMMGGANAAVNFGAMGLSFLLAMLVVMALAVPLYMALWFAPALIVLNNLKPVDAMKASFVACLKNILPFLIYGVILMVLCMIAAIPMGLGFLILGPVGIASIYAGYRDIFTAG